MAIAHHTEHVYIRGRLGQAMSAKIALFPILLKRKMGGFAASRPAMGRFFSVFSIIQRGTWTYLLVSIIFYRNRENSQSGMREITIKLISKKRHATIAKVFTPAERLELR